MNLDAGHQLQMDKPLRMYQSWKISKHDFAFNEFSISDQFWTNFHSVVSG
jgi:hypothetical protein